ncbi:MAG TPA: prepilin peptidase [Vicinamibacterales bacterium]|jgi:leader peptidase (prepilin peptidase)/N-methyltransferase|nr:prepilin peptidase [Vicinamibacterales bacterium]
MILDTTQILVAGLFGLLIGSFLNVVIYRLPRGQSLVTPPSTCPGCGSRIRPIDNIPVLSWILLGGKCHQCGAPISVQYPIVELATGLLFLLVAWLTPVGPLLVARLLFVVILVVLFGIDLHHQILPNVITLPGIAIGFLFSLVTPPGWMNSLIGIALGGGILYAIAAAYYAVRREEGLGMGDVKMLAMIGAFLGWKAVLVTLILSSFAGALVGIGIIAFSRGSMRLALPFGTFLAVGAIAAMIVGEPLVSWYSGFFVP